MSPTSFGMLSPMRSQRVARALEAVDAAVVLLVQDVGRERVQAHAVRIVAVLGIGLGLKRPRATRR